MLRAGIPVVYEPRILVRHADWREADERAEQYRLYALSQGGFYGKYLRRGDLFMAVRIVAHYLRAGRRWLVASLRGDRETADFARAYLGGLWSGIVAGSRRRTTTRAERAP